MPSNINPAFPEQGIPTTTSVRTNFLAARDEILALQSALNTIDAKSPTGSFATFTAGAIPMGFLPMDGRRILLSEYPALAILPVSQYGDQWEDRQLRFMPRLNTCAFNGNRLVVAGEHARFYYSDDGLDFQVKDLNSTYGVHGMIVKDTKFYCCTTVGTVLESTDSITWVSRATGAVTALEDISWTGQNFVIVGASGRIATSPDAITWTTVTSGTTDSLNSCASNGNGIVFAGKQTIPSLYSLDHGATWQSTTGIANQVTSSIWNGEKFFAAGASGGVWSSTGGATWTLKSWTRPFTTHGLAWIDGRLWRNTSWGTIETSWDEGNSWILQWPGVYAQPGKVMCEAFNRLWVPGAQGHLYSSPTHGEGERVLPYAAPINGRQLCIRAF